MVNRLQVTQGGGTAFGVRYHVISRVCSVVPADVA